MREASGHRESDAGSVNLRGRVRRRFAQGDYMHVIPACFQPESSHTESL
jgi:hypothetical protein